ncbi:putative exbB/tolQ family transport protein [Campylobacter jejuni subsp. jejuni CG8486]|nr:putative exbB/tolQ family transport protein [Campylobacter jejuni subsp. jejuni CG8486]
MILIINLFFIQYNLLKFISIFLEKNMEFLKDYIDLIIFLILGIMAFIAFWCVVERMLFFRKINFKNYENQEQFDDAISENLTTIYIIYSNAPYIGLLGTVIGIMVTFYEMGLAGNIDVKSIIVGLSLALKATALGLLVAIPALMAYNALLRKVSLLSNAYKANKNA